MLPFYLQPAAAKLAWMLERPRAPWYLVAAAPAKLAFFLAYIVACFGLVRRAAAGPLRAGLSRLMAVWLAGGVLSVAALAMEFLDAGLPVSADVVGALSLMCFVYATALLALRVPLSYRPQPAPPKPRYANSLLSDADRGRFLAALTGCMETAQPYRDGELTLEQLAGQVAMTPHELSQLINDACGANFQEYLNRYRVAALQGALRDGRQAGASILELALASGFNSKSALNRVFKKHTGMTPSQFRSEAPRPES
jgi:AraC-like DNA-binding protein